MKKCMFISLITFLSLAAAAQSLLTGVRDDTYYNAGSNWVFNDSLFYIYSGQQLDTQLSYDYSQSTWKLRGRIITDHNSDGSTSDWFVQLRDTLTGVYSNTYYKFVFGYNAAGDTTSMLYQLWDVPTSSWLNYRRVYLYPDANHHDTLLIEQSWSSGWQNQNYIQQTFNPSGRQTRKITSQWSSGAYVPFTKETFVYDALGHLTSLVSLYWVTASSSWQNDNQFLYTWNSSGDNTQRQHQKWSTSPLGWDNDSLVYQSFDASHRILNQTAELYNTSTSVYDNAGQVNNTYDANGNMLSSESDDWALGAWEHYKKTSYQYDALNNKTYQLHEEYDNSIQMYVPVDRSYYYYDLNTGISESQLYSDISLYPNPSTSETHLKFENKGTNDVTITICDLMGRTVSTERRAACTGTNDITLDISALASGQYLVSISGAPALKIVKE